ncbi:hypothetical protein ACFE04_029608 [Oxalis oulophora]
MDCSNGMNNVAMRLVKSGFGVYGIDYQGHGKSAGPIAHIDDFNLLVDDCYYHFTNISVKEENKGKKKFLLGEAMGGAVALHLHLKNSNLWDGAILVAPMCQVAANLKPHPLFMAPLRKLTELTPKWKLIHTSVDGIIDIAYKEPKIRKEMRANPYHYKGRPSLKTGEEILKTCAILEKKIHDVQLSFLIIQGGEDHVIDISGSEHLYRNASSNDKSFKVYPKMWHGLLHGETLENINEPMNNTSSTTGNYPGRSPGSTRLGSIGGASRLRSSSFKKPPEPLRRAVADCLSSASGGGSSSTTSAFHHVAHAAVSSEASRTLRLVSTETCVGFGSRQDYLAASSTTDQVCYCKALLVSNVENFHSPAVVARCVSLLKRYLLRYKPSEEILLQIDRFCVNTTAECNVYPKRRSLSCSVSPSQQLGSSTVSPSQQSPLQVSSFASGALVKSLNYVRSLVAQHLPKRSFQAAAFSGAPPSARQSSLSSLLTRSFNSQLSPANGGDSLEKKETTTLFASKLSKTQDANGMEDLDYIEDDILKYRWLGEHNSPVMSNESDHRVHIQGINTHNFLEVGAASLLVGDVEAEMKSQPWRYFGTDDMPYVDKMIQPSSVTTIMHSDSTRHHLRAITASKRTKTGPRHIWQVLCSTYFYMKEEPPASTFRPRAHPLFQYRHYSEQQPLRLNPAEVCEVIAAVSSETASPNANNMMGVSSRLGNNPGKPSIDVAVSVLIKLVIDMYVMDSGTAAPITLSMLEEMLSSPKATCRVRAFDLVLNLGVHAHLLEPMVTDGPSTIEEEYSHEEDQHGQGKTKVDSDRKLDTYSAIDNLESWILNILYEILLYLVQMEEKEESVWSSALSCLLYFVCDRGKILRNRLRLLDIRVIKVLIETSRKNSWAELVHSKLICMLTNMFYQIHDDQTSVNPTTPRFLVDQLDLLGGVRFIFTEYALASSSEARRNLYLVLFDYVLHQINESCAANGVSEYTDDEIQPLATLLILADAPGAVYISCKLGVERIGELLSRSISITLSGYPNSERLNLLLENVTEKFNALINSFNHLDKEFSRQMQLTKSCKFLEDIEGSISSKGVGSKAKLAWATLHSLLHSERMAYVQNGYIWLGDLLISEISEGNNGNVWSNIKNLQGKIAHAGVPESSYTSDVPLSIWLMCGLLKSKNNESRWGFLFVLERLLIRCKILLDENESSFIGEEHSDIRLEKANAVVDIMSSALSLPSLVSQTTDRITILKMCDILFSQLCLKVVQSSTPAFGEVKCQSKRFSTTYENKKSDISQNRQDELAEEKADNGFKNITYSSLQPDTASMTALLLRGQAVVPMQLVARVPAALFYWPLIQLASAATDDIALGVAVGSKGRGNLPGATSDIRATLLLLLIGKCTADPAAFQEFGGEKYGEEFFRGLLEDTDSRVAYYSSAFLLKRMMTEKPEKYQQMLQNLVFKAQQSNNEKLLENPYLQMRGLLQLSNELGTVL